jgi:hypothetical protein
MLAMQYLYHETGKVAAWMVLILAGISVLGCDRPPPMNREVPVDQRIQWLVSDIDDFAQNADEWKLLQALFVPGPEHSREALSRFSAYRYEGKAPVLSGDSGTIAVTVKDAKTDKPVGEVQWSVTKVKGVWKIKDAPLPAASSSSDQK